MLNASRMSFSSEFHDSHMTLTFVSKKQRHAVYDMLHDTSVDDLLYKEYNNNDKLIESLFYNSVEIFYKNPMTIDTKKEVKYLPEASTIMVPLENRISTHLTESERRSILAYLEPSAIALCSGVCQLLQAEDNIWKDTKVGVICFILKPHNKEYVLSLLLPNPSGTSAKVLWTMRLSAFFETERTSDEHLLIFVMETFPRDICGLHFYDSKEAVEFHRVVVAENRSRVPHRASQQKRQAPPPPQAGEFEVIERLTELSGALTVDDGGKKHKKRFLGGLFTIKRKKKEKKKLEISPPSEFKHIEHLGLEKLSNEDQETFHHLIKVVDIQPGNEAQLQLIREIIATRGREVRRSMRLKQNSIHPSQSFARGPLKSLAESRNSIMVAHKQHRRTPREVKKGSMPRRDDIVITPPQQPVPMVKEIPIDHYLNPDWGATPSFEPPEKLHVITEYDNYDCLEDSKVSDPEKRLWGTTIELNTPPVPFRVESMQSPSPLERRKSPPTSLVTQESSLHVSTPPPIPDRKQCGSAKKTIWRIEVPLPNRAHVPQHSPPPTPPSSRPSPVPPSSAPSPTFERSDHSGVVAVPTALVSPVPPPPPPPPDLLSPSTTPPPSTEVKQRLFDLPVANTNNRKSLLEEIQNVDKGKLRHVDHTLKNILNDDISPIGDGGLLLAIQAELDKRREYIVTDSDDESNSTDNEWTD